MKKAILLLFVCSLTSTLNAQSNWNIGIQLAGIGNTSVYSSGMSNANALFTNSPYGSGQIGFYARRTLNNHFSLQTGLDFSEVGFSYMIAQDYSLLKADECHANELRIGTCITRVPVSLIYNSKLNCRNFRFIAGIGLAIGFVDKEWNDESINTVEVGETGKGVSSTMKSEVQSTNCVNGSFTSLIGAEKVFSKGNMLSLTFQGNCGFNTVAESTVNYTVDNKNYNHTFTNNGSYFGVALCYYFAPVGSRKATRNAPPKIKQQ